MQTQFNPNSIPAAIQEALSRRFERIVVFSGAGMSAESGIPTCRSGQNGLWSAFSPGELATPEAWNANKALVWGWYEWRRGIIQCAQPNPAHLAVAQLQTELGAAAITQNVDDLHERAGVQDVLHLHGSMFAPRCMACRRAHVFTTEPPEQALREITPPQCLHCGGFVRPGVVWFGENLDVQLVDKAQRLIQAYDLLLIVGTSGVVQPAAGLVQLAPASALVLEINPEDGAHSRHVNHHWRTTAAIGLPILTNRLLIRTQ